MICNYHSWKNHVRNKKRMLITIINLVFYNPMYYSKKKKNKPKYINNVPIRRVVKLCRKMIIFASQATHKKRMCWLTMSSSFLKSASSLWVSHALDLVTSFYFCTLVFLDTIFVRFEIPKALCTHWKSSALTTGNFMFHQYCLPKCFHTLHSSDLRSFPFLFYSCFIFI